MNHKTLFIILALTWIFYTCSEKDIISPNVTPDPSESVLSNYKTTELPDDISRLFISTENTDSDTVLIFIQGGPIENLANDGLENFPGYKNYNNVYVHQSQTFNPGVYIDGFNILNAQSEIDVSLKILYRVIKHISEKDKTIFVIGASYGAFLVTKYLSEYGNNVDKFVILAGRLDIEEEVWKGFTSRKYYYFPDAVTPTYEPSIVINSTKDNVHFTLIGAVAKDRYTEELSLTDMRNVLYVYGTNDINVGRLTPYEVEFLLTQGADLYKIENGDHLSPFQSPYVEIIWEKLIYE
jgi:pimeloyl-ACP methyl ester carboxylesterase